MLSNSCHNWRLVKIRLAVQVESSLVTTDSGWRRYSVWRNQEVMIWECVDVSSINHWHFLLDILLCFCCFLLVFLSLDWLHVIIFFGIMKTASDAIYRVSMYTFCLYYSTYEKQSAPFCSYLISSNEHRYSALTIYTSAIASDFIYRGMLYSQLPMIGMCCMILFIIIIIINFCCCCQSFRKWLMGSEISWFQVQ